VSGTRISQPKNQKAEIKTPVPGPKSLALREREEMHLAPGLQGFALMAGIVVSEARGSALTDVDGNTFIDIIGGIGVNGLGHSHPEFVKAVAAQVEKASVGSFTSEARVELFDRMAKLAPRPKLHRLQLYSSGAEAVESALRLAKCYTGKNEFVSFWGGFHGKTMGALSLMGSDFKKDLGPMVPGSHLVPYANCYRCPLKMKYPSCGMACVDMARKQLKTSSAGKIAAFVVEPMQGTAGNVIPPPDFLPAVRDLANEMGALLIADEMITGFGRTGKTWGIDHSGVTPDIVTLGKQFGGGFPISGVLSTDEITAAKPWSNPSGSSSSYGGNPLAAAAAAASLRVVEEEGLVENSARVGAYFLSKLKALAEKVSFIGDVRGAGLFIGVEMVKDRDTQEPLSKAACARIFNECLKRGLLTMAYAASFRIQPAMTIDEGTVDEAVAILDEVFELIEREGVWKA
jgi:4-aminobutyrate aminotransferase / (S)-3-amino-2-methylpropionate transaminase / 5-aminovalerate transaminase